MKKFSYLAKDAHGKMSSGELEAEDKKSAADSLSSSDLTPVSIKEQTAFSFLSKLNEITTIPAAVKVMFSKELSTLVSAGVPISQAMHILEDQTENARMKNAVTKISEDIEGGLSLSAAMAKQKKVFPPLYSSMIQAGEIGGILDQTLEKMADEIEAEHDLISKIRGAMAYPTVILIAMVLVVIYMLTNVVPQIAGVFTEMGGKLPASTQFMITLSDVIKKYGILIAIGVATLVFFLRRLIKTNKKVRYICHSIILKLPVFGKLIQKINIARFTRTLGSLLSSGVAVLEALQISAETIQNEVFKKEILECAEKVKNGSTIAEPLKKSKKFPIIVPQMIAIGEETGSLDSILLKVTEFYEKDIDNTVKNLSGLIEPLMMIIIGAGVGFIVISVISPIYQMTNLF